MQLPRHLRLFRRVFPGSVNDIQHRHADFTNMHYGDVWQAVQHVFLGAWYTTWVTLVRK